MKSPVHSADGTPDPASRVETLREHLEASMASFSDMEKNYKTTCHEMFAHAVAALWILGTSQGPYGSSYAIRPGMRLVDDPDPLATAEQLAKDFGWDSP